MDTDEYSSPLPDDAREALSRSGQDLFRHLDSERLESLPERVHEFELPLPVEARSSLQLQGDGIFRELDEERATILRARRPRPWGIIGGMIGGAAAAALLFIAIPLTLINLKKDPGAPVFVKAGEITSPDGKEEPGEAPILIDVSDSTDVAVPEPSSTMLLLAAGLLGLRRRRP